MELVGIAEVAERLGWPRRRVTEWHRQGKLPPPLAVLQAGPVWRRQDIEAFARGEAPQKRQGLRPLTVPAMPRTHQLWEASIRVAAAAEAMFRLGARPRPADFDAEPSEAQVEVAAAEHLERSLVLGAEQALLWLLSWREDAWPAWAQATVEDTLTALTEAIGQPYRIREGRLERKGRHGRWQKVPYRPMVVGTRLEGG